MTKITNNSQSDDSISIEKDTAPAPLFSGPDQIFIDKGPDVDSSLAHVDEYMDGPIDGAAHLQEAQSDILTEALVGKDTPLGDIGLSRNDVFDEVSGGPAFEDPGAGQPSKGDVLAGTGRASQESGEADTPYTAGQRAAAQAHYENEAKGAHVTGVETGDTTQYVVRNIADHHARALEKNTDPKAVNEAMDNYFRTLSAQAEAEAKAQKGGDGPAKTERPAPDDAGGGGGPDPLADEDVVIPVRGDIDFGENAPFGGAPGTGAIFDDLGNPSVDPNEDDDTVYDPAGANQNMTPEALENPSVDPVDAWL